MKLLKKAKTTWETTKAVETMCEKLNIDVRFEDYNEQQHNPDEDTNEDDRLMFVLEDDEAERYFLYSVSFNKYHNEDYTLTLDYEYQTGLTKLPKTIKTLKEFKSMLKYARENTKGE